MFNFDNAQQVEGRELRRKRKKEFPPKYRIPNQSQPDVSDIIKAIKEINK